MTRFLVIVMCPSARAPPVPVRRLASSATKSPTTQKAAYVPRHISGQFFQGSLIEPFAWIRARLDQCGDGNVATFVVRNCALCSLSQCIDPARISAAPHYGLRYGSAPATGNFQRLRGRPPLVSPLKSCIGRSFTAMLRQLARRTVPARRPDDNKRVRRTKGT
jgi:hypothetical protein